MASSLFNLLRGEGPFEPGESNINQQAFIAALQEWQDGAVANKAEFIALFAPNGVTDVAHGDDLNALKSLAKDAGNLGPEVLNHFIQVLKWTSYMVEDRLKYTTEGLWFARLTEASQGIGFTVPRV